MTETPARETVAFSRSRARLLDGVAAALCAIALAAALVTVRDLRWPFADDHFRDIAQARSALNGHPFADPYYAGERIWYNPLVPWLVSVGAWLSNAEPATFHVQAGPWLNLFGPIAFYLLAVRLGGRETAVAALVIFLFVNGHTGYAREHATYSPWLFVANFAQGLFYLGVLALLSFRDKPSFRQAVVVGVIAGLTFLAHTAPAVLIALLVLLTLKGRKLIVSAAAGLVVASPFLYWIVVHYALRVLNPAPMRGGPWLTASVLRFPELLVSNAVLFLLAAVGLAVLKDRLIRGWLGLSLTLVAYGVWCDLVPALPRIVPTYHFWRYASAAMTVYAGAAILWVIGRWARDRAPAAAVAAIVTVIALFPRYMERPDFWGRAMALRRSAADAWLTERLRGGVAPDEVVLASSRISLEVVGPAGRKVVALHPVFSNPYVDVTARTLDQQAMFDALEEGDGERFLALAGRRGVGHVIATGAEQCGALNHSPLVLTGRYDEACVFAVVPP